MIANPRNGMSLEAMRALAARTIAKEKHGLSRTREYNIWYGMLYRCRSSKTKAFKFYGARGIKVCDRWSLFENFYEDMGICPDGWTIERKDVYGDYYPANCCWLARAQQGANTRRNKFVVIENETMTIAAAMRKVGRNPGAAHMRVRNGRSPNIQHAVDHFVKVNSTRGHS